MKYKIELGNNYNFEFKNIGLCTQILNRILIKFDYDANIRRLFYNEKEDKLIYHFENEYWLKEYLLFIRDTHKMLYKTDFQYLDEAINKTKLGYTLNSLLNLQQQMYDCDICFQDIIFVLNLGENCEVNYNEY